jgi:signal transduction histidine kinase
VATDHPAEEGDATTMTGPEAAAVGAGIVLAGAAGLLPPRFGAAAVPILGGILGATLGFAPNVVLAPGCAYLFVALTRALVLERATRKRMAASFAATRAAETREAVLSERTRIAGDIHDVVAHTVSALLVQLTAVRSLLDDHPVDVPRIRLMIDRSVEVARASMHESQTVVGALRGAAPGWPQIRQLVEDFAATASLSYEVSLPDPPPALHPDAALAMYRTVQEALTNIVRHSQARLVRVESRLDDADVVTTVEDIAGPGREPAPTLPSGGQGLAILRDRVAAAGGHLVAGPTPTGFRVRLSLPTAGR